MSEDQAPPTTALTLDDLKAAFQELRQELQTDFTAQVNGLAAKTSKRIEALKKESDSARQELLNALKPPDNAAPEEPPTDTPAAPNADPVAEFRQQLERERRARQKAMDEMNQKLQQSEAKAQRLQAVQSFSRVAGDRVTDVDALLTLAESRGLVTQADGEFRVLTGKDEYTSEPIYAPIEAGLGTLLQQFPYMERPRPGNGTGATPGDSPTPPTPKYNDTKAITSAVMDGKGLDVIAEIQGL